jgi:hypothetical protein
MRTRTNIMGPALLIVLSAAFSLSAETVGVERFSFARPSAPESTVDPKGRMSIDLDRWSTTAERDQLVKVIAENGPEQLLDAFREVGRIGTLSWPGGLEYTVRYAWRSQRADGSDVVFVVDRPLWVWWDVNTPSTPYQFTVIQMRLGKDGRGEGRASLGVPVASDKTLGVTLSDYVKATALLADVRRDQPGSY